MTPREKSELLGRFADWARERGLSTHRHDAQFHGRLRDVPVEVETGIRDSDLYGVVATINVACGTPLRVLRDRGELPDDPAVIARLRTVLRQRPSLRSIRIDESAITLRMLPGTPPSEVGDALDDALLAALSTPTGAAYR